MLIYGSRARHGSTFKLKEIPCSHCGQEDTHTMSFFTRYGYLYWIPFVPLSKVSVTECDHCKKTSPEEEYSPTLLNIRQQLAEQVKSPKWYWAGSILLVGIIAIVSIVGAVNTSRDNADFRSGMLKADISLMTNTPDKTQDSVSFVLDQIMSGMIMEELEPENTYYLTKRYGHNMLVLMSIPYFDDVEEEARKAILPLIENMVTTMTYVNPENLYIGVMNNDEQFLLVKTPTDSSYSNYATKQLLYDFYGEPIE